MNDSGRGSVYHKQPVTDNTLEMALDIWRSKRVIHTI